jgi:pseudouridine-5'-monophosphatase
MGIPDSTNGDVLHDWAKLPISRAQFAQEASEEMRRRFPDCVPLPGAEQLLSNLSRARCGSSGDKIELALASSTRAHIFTLKTSKPEAKRLINNFQPDRQILGEDARIRRGRGKPAPDIYLVALQVINSSLGSCQKQIMPEECLVFEDSIIGVEAGRRAGMRVVWVPHVDLAAQYEASVNKILAGRTNTIDIGDTWQLGEVDDGWAETISSLEEFDYENYGIDLPLESS